MIRVRVRVRFMIRVSQVTCVVSIDYLTHPIAVMRETNRALKNLT